MTPKDVLLSFCDQILSLQTQQDESALNAIALIQTLTELLPGFEQKFAILRSGAETACAPGAAEEIERLRKEIGRAKSN